MGEAMTHGVGLLTHVGHAVVSSRVYQHKRYDDDLVGISAT